MLCPNCGTRGAADQKFCRSCGMDLGPVAEALAAHLAQDETHAKAGADDARRAAERSAAERSAAGRMAGLMFTGIVVFVLGLLSLSLSKLYGLGRTGTLLGLLFVFASMLLMAYSLFNGMRAAARTPRRRPRPLEESAPTEPLLSEAASEPVPSVTERTTELLGVERKNSGG